MFGRLPIHSTRRITVKMPLDDLVKRWSFDIETVSPIVPRGFHPSRSEHCWIAWQDAKQNISYTLICVCGDHVSIETEDGTVQYTHSCGYTQLLVLDEWENLFKSKKEIAAVKAKKVTNAKRSNKVSRS